MYQTSLSRLDAKFDGDIPSSLEATLNSPIDEQVLRGLASSQKAAGHVINGLTIYRRELYQSMHGHNPTVSFWDRPEHSDFDDTPRNGQALAYFSLYREGGGLGAKSQELLYQYLVEIGLLPEWKKRR